MVRGLPAAIMRRRGDTEDRGKSSGTVITRTRHWPSRSTFTKHQLRLEIHIFPKIPYIKEQKCYALDSHFSPSTIAVINTEMLSCFGFRSRDEEHEPLLPRYNDDTTLQTRLHEKLHTYQMLRAMSHGYMPSNEQVIIHLRSLLSADVLNPDTPDLSDSGRSLIRSTKLFLTQFIDLLSHKNSHDQIQDFIWCLAKARLHVDTADLAARAGRVKAKADTQAAYESLRTVGSLLLTNSDFRVFLSDLGTVSREVFRDTAFSLANVSKQTAEELDPEEPVQANGSSEPPSKQDLEEDVKDVAKIVSKGAVDVAHDAEQSVAEHISGDEGKALAQRLKKAVGRLRKRPDYSSSVSTLSMLLQRYMLTYSHVVVDTASALEDDVNANPEADRALHNFWLLLTSIGDKSEWKGVEESLNALIDDGKTDPNFDEFVQHLTKLIHEMLSDPDFFDQVSDRFQQLREKSHDLTARSSMSEHLDQLLVHAHAAMQSVLRDEDIHKLLSTSSRIMHTLSPSGAYTNSALITDSINVFVPMVIQAIQYIPIPRVEVSTPAIDLLLENLILEPGRTVNASSFFPFKFNVSTRNDVEVRKARLRTTSSLKSLVTIKISGMSIAAEDLGYWFRVHSGLMRFVDQGLAGFHLDERGLDIALDIEIGRDRMDKIVSLRRVGVTIHHLNYSLTKSKFACIAWLLKPIIRPIVKRALEAKIAAAIAEGLQTLNRELLFARERLRATRIASPDDLWTFVKAVAARLTPAPDPDVEARIGVKTGAGVFRGRYAPGSLMRIWEEEGRMAAQRVYEYQQGGWRNSIFDVHAVPAS